MAIALVVAGACSGDDDTADVPPKDKPDREADGGAVEPVASEGCGGSSVGAGEEKVTLRSGDVDRWYYRHVPPAHDGKVPVPVIVDIHGYSEGADVHVKMSALGPYGDEEGFVTLTPHGAGAVPMWQTTPDSVDVTFIGAMLDAVEQDLCVDRARIFVTGLSNGAMMTSNLACALADRFAAAAPVAGVTAIDGCDPARVVPVVAFHGTEDPFLDYEGGFGPAVANLPTPDGKGTIGDLQEGELEGPDAPDVSQSVPEVMAAWAERNGCDEREPAEKKLADDVTTLTFACPAGSEVELYRVEKGGHTWPGSELLKGVDMVGPTTFSISANEVMWAFFQDHPLA